MESAGLVASSFSVEGRRKKKVYFLPNEDMKKGSSNS
jgi:predicted transcriptional regulator